MQWKCREVKNKFLNIIKMELTIENRKKLKREKRIGFVFAVLIIAFGALINLAYILSNQAKGFLMPLFIASGIIGLSCLVAFFMNRRINRDLRAGIKEARVEQVEKKRHKVDYEAGSGVLYIPILGDLFPRLWKPKMNEYSKYILTLKGVEYDVEKELFDNRHYIG
jgi:hypothetical protein